MRTIVEAFDSEVGRDIQLINLPIDYKPSRGQVVDSTNGRYQVNGYTESDVGGFALRIQLFVSKIPD